MTAPATAKLQADLYYKDNGSDKEYHVWLNADDTVGYAYGPRGGTMQVGIKGSGQAVYDRVVKEKLAKGYHPTNPGFVSPGGPASGWAGHTGTAPAGDAIPVMLLEPIDEQVTAAVIAQDGWLAQPKYDGKRMIIRKTGTVVSAQNRKLGPCGFPAAVKQVFEMLPTTDIALDGEMVGDCYWCFDILRLDGQDLRDKPLRERLTILTSTIGHFGAVRVGDAAWTADEKAAMYHRLKAERAEGIVFKKLSEPYRGGRQKTAMKCKFWKTASVIVLARNDTKEVWTGPGAQVFDAKAAQGQRSVQMLVYGPQGEPYNLGDMSVPANWQMPAPGTIVESRYLYAFEASKQLYQPQYEGERDDLDHADCVLAQLRYKQERE